VGSLQQDPTRPEGTELGTPERLISIDPVTSGGFAATQSNLSSTAHLLVKMGDGGNVASDSDEFRPLESSRNLSPQWRKDPESTGITVGKGDSSRSYRYGTGQGSNVAYPLGSRERSHGVKIDESGNQILSPSFITLGHELYHAQHSLEGTAFNTEQASSETDKENQRLLAESSRGDADDYAWYENTEEYVTIAHNENYLREQYGLSSRATHTVQCMYLVGQLDPIKQRLEPENPQYAYIEQLQLVLQKAGWAEIKRSKPVDPEFEGVIAAQEKQVGVLLGDLKMRTIEEALSHVEELLRHAPVEKDLPKSSSSSVIKPQAKATVESPKSSSSRPEGVLPGLMPELPGRLVNVSGDGRNCLIRAVLLAAGVQAYEDYVEPIREHIVKQVGDVERGQMLDLALAEGAILLSYLQSQGLLSAKRALHVYFSTGAHTQVQDGVDPVNIYLSNEHFQAIV
jgi:hypothetical protein